MASKDDDSDVIRKVVLTIRRKTRTRAAIQIIISQSQDPDTKELETPIIFFPVGSLPALIESPRFAEDVGKALLVAAYFAEEWLKYNDGRR